MTEDNPIGLRNEETMGGISLEPGGQFELSGAPQPDLHGTAAETAEHMRVAKEVAGPLDIHFLGLGVTPLWSRRPRSRRMPKSRYGIMAPYMEKVGTLGTSMMFRSARCRPIWIFPAKPTWSRSCASRWRCSRWRRRCSPIRPSSTARTAAI